MAQALANGDMGPGDELQSEEEQEGAYLEDEAQQDTLEQVGTFCLACCRLLVQTCSGCDHVCLTHCRNVHSCLQESTLLTS